MLIGEYSNWFEGNVREQASLAENWRELIKLIDCFVTKSNSRVSERLVTSKSQPTNTQIDLNEECGRHFISNSDIIFTSDNHHVRSDEDIRAEANAAAIESIQRRRRRLEADHDHHERVHVVTACRLVGQREQHRLA